jgi:hypothetical protein
MYAVTTKIRDKVDGDWTVRIDQFETFEAVVRQISATHSFASQLNMVCGRDYEVSLEIPVTDR